MTRKGDKFTFNGEELTMLYFALSLRIREMTNSYTSEPLMKLYEKEIELIEQITETL